MVYYDILRSCYRFEEISVQTFKWDSHVKLHNVAVLGAGDPLNINFEDSNPQKALPFAKPNRLVYYV